MPVHLEYSGNKRRWLKFRPSHEVKIYFGEIIGSEYFVENFEDEVRHEAVMREVWRVRDMCQKVRHSQKKAPEVVYIKEGQV